MAVLTYWKAPDVQRHIAASLVMAMSTAAAHGNTNVEYLRGIVVHAQVMALSFGLAWPTVIADCRDALGDDLQALLEGVKLIDG